MTPPSRRLPADEEDVALSALDSFIRGAERGRFPQLRDRHNFWPLLVLITARKAYDLLQYQRRKRRYAGRVLDEAALSAGGDSSPSALGLDQVIGREPTPEFVAQVTEECRRLLDLLDSEELRSIAVCKMEGYLFGHDGSFR